MNFVTRLLGSDVNGLHTAASQGDLPEVRRILASRVSVDIPCTKSNLARMAANPNGGGSGHDSRGWTALMFAAWEGHTDVARVLLDAGANANARTFVSTTPLTLATQRGHMPVVRLLLRRGAFTSISHSAGRTAVIVPAAATGNAELVKLFLDTGVSADDSGENRHTALIAATVHRHADVMRLLLENGADVNIRDSRGASALTYAMHQVCEETLSILFAAKPELDLHVAAALGDTNTIARLLDAGISSSEADPFGWTPLRTAIRYGQKDAVALLLAQGAQLYADAQPRGTMLAIAAERDEPDMAAYLLDSGASDLAHDGPLALVVAARGGHIEVVRFLLDRGVDCNANGGAALRETRAGALDILSLLLDRGANVNLCPPNHYTALMNACINDKLDSVILLLSHGADTDRRSPDGLTALQIAQEHEEDEIIEVLKAAGAS